ncbi:hypothetical protein RB594_007280 [Gaeumannomyces avenae]
MASPDDLIDFDVIESQKENIQSLPGGRSARKLAELYTASPLAKMDTPTPSDTKNVHDCIRAEYEAELDTIADLDDPLDVYDRYVRWTLDAYPSAQATPQSQLHILLERATKAFIGSSQYKNDPRYLKLWLYYTQMFSDAPRETFLYLSRHGIGESLALFYEEYAAWLEGAGRWVQAEEVLRLGIDREARPQQRLIRKLGEFEQRREQNGEADGDEPSSPAIPTVRPALAAKVDPFAAAAAAGPVDPQAPRPSNGVGGRAAKPAKSKLAIFSDADTAGPALPSHEAGSKGWDSIGSLAERKKENVMAPKSWVGETLKAGSKKASGPKLAVFKDTSLLMKSHIPIVASQHQVTMNNPAGKKQRIVFDLSVLYPSPEIPGSELSFEEVLLARAGWLDERPAAPSPTPPRHASCGGRDENSRPSPSPTPPRRASPPRDENSRPSPAPVAPRLEVFRENNENVPQKLVIHRDVVVPLDENGAPIKAYPKEGRPKKKKVTEVNETQIIKAKLDSPSRPKLLKKKGSSEPTMTMHTRAATDDIYDIFNAPIKHPTNREEEEEDGSADDDDYDTDEYTSGAESTGTTRRLSISEAEDEDNEGAEDDEDDAVDGDETADSRSVSEWSDFTARKHIPLIPGVNDENDEAVEGEGDITQLSHVNDGTNDEAEEGEEEEGVSTPVDDEQHETRTTFVPIPPEDYVPQTRTYRDPVEMANNRLPFMTPITERTETELDLRSVRTSLTKTPSRCQRRLPPVSDDEDEDEVESQQDAAESEPPSSPLQDLVGGGSPSPQKPSNIVVPVQLPKAQVKSAPVRGPPKGPLINDTLCNPVDDAVRAQILTKMHPPLSSQLRFYDHRPAKYEKAVEIRRFAKARAKAKSSGEKTGSVPMPPPIEFPGCEMSYTVKKELGAGAFAPVYLVENSSPDAQDDDEDGAISEMGKGAFSTMQTRRDRLEALKMETPPSAWEFHMMRLAHGRLGPHERATASLSSALEMHLYQDESFLLLPLHPHGTLLDVVNLFRAEPSGTMDELLAMFFAIELLRTAEALHAHQILHGDLKADNCLLRLDAFPAAAGGGELSSKWRADGSGGWASRGVTLIDFGRGIDMRAFRPDVQFVADWKTSPQDCAEMREGRPWTWQIDYHGLAGTVHCLLFGRYIETVRCEGGGLGTAAGRRYRVRESLKRYWQTELWSDCFDLLLNPAAHAAAAAAAAAEDGDGRMPVLKGMRSVRERMEAWLEANCERGVGLKSLMSKVEAWAKGRR